MKPINKFRTYKGDVLSTYDDPETCMHVVFIDLSNYYDPRTPHYDYPWGDVRFTHDNQVLPRNLEAGDTVKVVVDKNLHMISINVFD